MYEKKQGAKPLPQQQSVGGFPKFNDDDDGIIKRHHTFHMIIYLLGQTERMKKK